MNLEPGLAVVIVAVLVFYLRLIGLQRERAKRAAVLARQSSAPSKKKKKAGPPHQTSAIDRFTILSTRPADRVIALVGVALILLGVLLYAGLLPLVAIQPFWWLPTSIGIVAFSWAFKV